MDEFNAGDQIELPYGVRVRAVDVSGRVDDPSRASISPGQDRGDITDLGTELARDGIDDAIAAAVVAAAGEADLAPHLSVPFPELNASSGAPQPGTRSVGDVPRIELEVTAPGLAEAQVALEADASGVLRWHYPTGAGGDGGQDRAGGVQTFAIPIDSISAPGAADDRGIFGFGVKKVIHILRFPIQVAAGKAAEFTVGRWESTNRPHQLRPVRTPDEIKSSIPVESRQSNGLLDGRALLLVHGTFSSARGGFAGLADDPALVASLNDRYQGRMVALDHPSVSVDPRANARWLLEQLPNDATDFDIVTHSRGGLVARHLLDPALAAELGRAPLSAGKLVFVAVPNAGTALASPERIGTLLDIATNLLALLPDDPITTGLSTVIEIVKQVASGVIKGLDGLASMTPEGEPLKRLAEVVVAASSLVGTVASDFEPAGASPMSVLDGLVDGIFAAANDLVVPTDGVAKLGETQCENFAVPAADHVIHTTYFHNDAVRQQLADWLLH